MNTRSQRKRIYSWVGKAISTNRQLQISHYRGISIKCEKNINDIYIFPGEFILVEEEEYNQRFVARLLRLYEDGTQEKHAVVEWFSRTEEIPLSLQNSLGQKAYQEIFLNEKAEWDTDIFVSSIVSNVKVIPLSPCESLPINSKDKQIMFVRKSWDGKKLKPLQSNVLAELKNSVKTKNEINFATEYHLTPSRSLEETTENVTWSTRGSNEHTAEVKLRHSVAKSSLFKQRHSPKMAGGDIPGAKKRLQLNTPTKSPRNMLAEQQDMSKLLDYDFTETAKRSALKRKVTFTGIKCSPKKISWASDEEDLLSDIKPLEEQPERATTNLPASYQRNQDYSLRIRSSAVTQSAKDLDEEHKLEARNPAVTPRSRRKCAQATATRIAEQISILNAAEVKGKDKRSLTPLESSDSDSSDEEDIKMLHTPKRQTKFTPNISKKQSMGTPAKDLTNTSKPRTPKTPQNATPRIPSRNQVAQKPSSVLEEARMRLHVSAVPESLPCREKEFQDICNFIESKLLNGTGGCMYISGVPGTGKTATVHEAIQYLHQAAENKEIPSFQFIEINGMKLTEPHQAYVLILKLLTGQKTTANHAAEILKKIFCKPGSKRKTVVLVVDELDLLWTRKQNVMYNLFDWPTQKDAKLIVLAIANTMDLPERIMIKRVASRLGLTRMSFQPYTYKQLQQIISSRVNQLKAFEEDAVQLISRKVAALSGDARRCLDICRRSTEICERDRKKSISGLVKMAHVMEAMNEMFSSPYINTIRNASLQEQIFLKATIAEFHRSGLEEATIQQIFCQHVALCRIEGLPTPTVSEIMAISSRLSSCKLLLAESSAKYLSMRVRLNISQNDIMYALKQNQDTKNAKF